jgi:fatty acid desaturase
MQKERTKLVPMPAWPRHNIFRDRDSVGNDLLGLFAGLVMHGSFEQFVGIHLKHHASVNDPQEDPDLHARAPIYVEARDQLVEAGVRETSVLSQLKSV